MFAAPHLQATVAAVQRYLLPAAAFLALFAWLTPTHQLPWTSFHAELAMACAASLAGACVLWCARTLPARVSGLTILTLLAASIPWIQLATGVIAFLGDAALTSLYLVGFALMQVVGHRAVACWGLERTLEAFSWVVLAGAALSAALALYQWLQLDFLGVFVGEVSRDMRPFANLNQPNQLATLLVLGLLCTASLFDAAKLSATAALSMLILFSFCLAMTQSRAGTLEVVIVGVMLVAKAHLFARRLRLRHVLIGVPMVLLMPLVWEAANALTAQFVIRDAAVLSTAVSRRIMFWSAMWDAVWRQPWVGYGWNQTAAAQFAVAPDHPVMYEVFNYGHNIVIDLIVWNGVLLGSLLLAGLALWLWAATRGARGSAVVLALAYVVAVLVHALLEFPMYYAYFLLPVGGLMGAISAIAVPHSSFPVPRWTAPGLMVTTVAALGIVALDYFELERDVTGLRFEQARIGIDRPRRELSDPLLLTQIGAFTRFARTREREHMNESELRAMAAVTVRFPSGSNSVRYAAALALNERPASASSALQRVCKMSSTTECDQMKELWRTLGDREPGIAAVPWPAD